MRNLVSSIFKCLMVGCFAWLMPSIAAAQYYIYAPECVDSIEVERSIMSKLDSMAIEFEIDFLKVPSNREDGLNWPETQAELEFFLAKFQVEERGRLVEYSWSEPNGDDEQSEIPCREEYKHWRDPIQAGIWAEKIGWQYLISEYNVKLLNSLNSDGQKILKEEIKAWEVYKELRMQLIDRDFEGASGCGGTAFILEAPRAQNQLLLERLEVLFLRYQYGVMCQGVGGFWDGNWRDD